MRPLAVLIGIVFGSSVSLAVGLAMTGIVMLFLPGEAEAFAGERMPLLRAIGLFGLMAAAAGASLYGELRRRAWRYFAHATMLAMLALATWVYWPR